MDKVLCTICARGGSKGVPNKNMRSLGGIPLIGHTIKQALESEVFSYVTVSSDSDEILNFSKKAGACEVIKRPSNLARDNTPKLPVIKHAALESERAFEEQFEYMFDLDCTSPLRTTSDIKLAVQMLKSEKAPNLVTVTKARKNPYFNMLEVVDGAVQKPCSIEAKLIGRRQDAPKVFDMNASIYGWRREALFEAEKVSMPDTLLYEMPETSAYDIDSEVDWVIVQTLYHKYFRDSR